MRPAVFLDRDDTIIHNTDLPESAWGGGTIGDLLDPRYVEPIHGAIDACTRLREAGFVIVVFTSQGGVARGGGQITDVEHTNDRVRAILSSEPDTRDLFPRDPLVDAFYFCPMHPLGTVDRFTRETVWRKPGPGMISTAADELGIDLSRSWAVGDMTRDVDAGVAAGIANARCILIGPDGDAPDLASAADHIIEESAC